MKILIAEPSHFSKPALKKLEYLGNVVFGPFKRETLLKEIEDTEVLVLRLFHTIDEEVLNKATHLRYILTPTTGLNHIDINIAEKKGIKIISLKGETQFLQKIPSTAEHTWALLLALVRKIPFAHQHVISGEWNRDLFKSRNLNKLKLGILGYGRVGQQIANFAETFKMSYCFYDTDAEKQELKHAAHNFDEFLTSIDILSIHIPLTSANEDFIDKKVFQKLKKGAFLINTSRGEVIVEKEFIKALGNGILAGAAIDVISGETNLKPKKSKLIAYAQNHQNLIITPHIAGATYDSMWLTEDFIVNKFIEIWKEK